MTTPLESLVASGTRLWLDSVEPQLVGTNRQWGVTGATSNPEIIFDLLRSGRFDDEIQTNPPATNEAVQQSGRRFSRQVARLPPPEVLAEIEEKVDPQRLERVLMDEGIKKFADPQKALLTLIGERQAARPPGPRS